MRLPDSRTYWPSTCLCQRGLPGLAGSRDFRIEGDFTQDELNATSRYLIDTFRSGRWLTIRDEMLLRMSEEKALYDQFLRNAVLLCSQSLQEGDHLTFYRGASNIIAKPDSCADRSVCGVCSRCSSKRAGYEDIE